MSIKMAKWFVKLEIICVLGSLFTCTESLKAEPSLQETAEFIFSGCGINKTHINVIDRGQCRFTATYSIHAYGMIYQEVEAGWGDVDCAYSKLQGRKNKFFYYQISMTSNAKSAFTIRTGIPDEYGALSGATTPSTPSSSVNIIIPIECSLDRIDNAIKHLQTICGCKKSTF